MSTLESYSMESPFGKTEECAKFTIDDVTVPFVLHDILRMGQQYILSFWIKADAEGTLITYDKANSVTTEWTKHVVVFTAGRIHLNLLFAVAGTYYIYHPQLEIGNKVTDWTPSPEDVDEGIKDAKDTADSAKDMADSAMNGVGEAKLLIDGINKCIQSLVTDENGSSLMTQTADGWTFSIGSLQKTIDELKDDVDGESGLKKTYDQMMASIISLQTLTNDHSDTLEYVHIGKIGDQPVIELGESDSDKKLLITNDKIIFKRGSNDKTYIDDDGLATDNLTVNNEIKQGGWVEVIHDGGNKGLVWKGVS